MGMDLLNLKFTYLQLAKRMKRTPTHNGTCDVHKIPTEFSNGQCMLKDKKVEANKSKKQVVYAFNTKNFSNVLRYNLHMEGPLIQVSQPI